MNVMRLLRTLRHLRAVQVVSRVRPRRRAKAPVVRSLHRPQRWRAPVVRQPLALADGSALALYNAHYHDAVGATAIVRWIDENPPFHGIGWEPYPTSLRVVNWSKWLLAGNEPVGGMLASLALQAEHVARNLERHLLGNHLIANAKALLFAGTLLQHDRWLRIGESLLRRELDEQILDDGGHFERSPMYHALIAEDLLDLDNLLERFGERVPKMLDWLATMTHPDGQIAFFNDAALGVGPTLVKLCAYAGGRAEARPTRLLPDSGFARLVNDRAVVIADVGSVGPRYQPGHAHAGTLSFELSIDGQRTVVNSGTSTYAAGPQREWERSTAAHNTVVVEGRDSSEVWASFRVGRRARVVERSLRGNLLAAAHDGYGLLHHRTWELRDDALVVRDRLSRAAQAEAWLHFAPRKLADISVEGGEATALDSTYHPRFGASIPNRALRIRITAPELVTTISWR